MARKNTISCNSCIWKDLCEFELPCEYYECCDDLDSAEEYAETLAENMREYDLIIDDYSDGNGR
jgi:hypothetical protein